MVCCQNKDDVLLWAQDNITVVDVITQDVTLVLEPPSDASAYSFTPTQASRRQLQPGDKIPLVHVHLFHYMFPVWLPIS